MEYASAELLAMLLVHITDIVVGPPTLIVGFVANGWRQYLIGGAVVWVIVLAIKVPMIRDMAVRLNIPDRSLVSIAVEYAIGIAVIIGLVAGFRYLFRLSMRAR